MAGLITQWRDRYGRFERRVHRRIRGWSPKRRLIAFVIAPVLGLCCCGGPLAVPLGWAAHETIEAGKGEVTPEAAVTVYLMRLSFGYPADNELALFDDDHQAELSQQWTNLRTTMTAAAMGAPDELDFTDLTSHPTADDKATVTAEVFATWWHVDSSVGALRSAPKRWEFQARNDGGWRISQATVPPWCGTGGYVIRCDQSELPAAAPSPSPSHDPLQGPRTMLPCGPKDPFPELHSCPPQ